tara:strand:- start:2035 stop:3405 length:1371 start_codon:yes stop_codon:yes gene_type:complete
MKNPFYKSISQLKKIVKIGLIITFSNVCDNRYTIPTNSNENINTNTNYSTDVEYLNSILTLNNIEDTSPLEIGIQTWENNRLTELIIQNYSQITVLPNSINLLDQLNTLKLDNNSLVQIPFNICLLDIDFTNSESFNISGNYLCPNDIPYCIEAYSDQESQYCDWDSNDLVILQEIINLNGLNITLNELGGMQNWDFGRLISFSITDNESIGIIHTLPESFGLLNGLIYLDLSNNLLNTLPESFGDLSNLEFLNLSSNRILYLPDSFGDLTLLSQLDLNENRLSYLPNSFSNLESCNYLNLSFNQFSIFPEEITSILSLESINLSINFISEISPNITNLNILSWLDLHYNEIKAIPESIIDLQFLNYLDLGYNQLENFDFDLTEIIFLNTLYLDNNFLTTISGTICNSYIDYNSQYNFLIENNNLCIETVPECIADENILGYQGCIESISKNLIHH